MKTQQLKLFLNRVIKENQVKNIEEEIQKYDGICSKELLDYLESLLGLEINILNDKTYNKEKIERLKQLEIYRRIVKYNIYGYIKATIENIDRRLKISKYKENILEYPVTYKGNELIDLSFENEKVKETMVELTCIKENIEKRNNALEIILFELESELGEKNPYHEKYIESEFEIDDIENNWIFNHRISVKKLENMLKELDKRTELTKKEKEISELSQCIYNEFIEQYKLNTKKTTPKTNIDFNEEKIKEKQLIKQHQLANIYKTTIYY